MLGLAGCVGTTGTAPLATAPPHVLARYGVIQDGPFRIPAVPPSLLNIRTYRAVVAYTGPEAPGTIIVDPYARFLYFVTGPQRAYRYGIAVGRAGTSFAGSAVVRRKERWPAWTPTTSMIRSHPEMYADYVRGLPGGPGNPLGARALYLYRGGRDTFFRIHGTNDVRSIGHATSAGCIRLFNHDILDLYDRAPPGTPVKVRTKSESRLYEGVLKQRPDGTLVQLEPPVIWPEGY
jgi:lipoprotein-anchoring transpeptidase ErfK/SrfK